MFTMKRMKNDISLKNLLKSGLYTGCQEKEEGSCLHKLMKISVYFLCDIC